MRILHIADSYLPTMGGIEMHVSDLATRQQALGHDVRILTATTAVSDEPDVIPVIRLPRSPLTPGTGRIIQRIVEEEKIELVHMHVSVGSPLVWSALRVPMSAGRIATMHSVLPNSRALLRTWMSASRFRRHEVMFTAVSDVAAEPLRAAMPGVPVGILSNGIDPSHWAIPQVDNEIFTVASVGRFNRRKRPRALVRILADVRASLPPTQEFRALLVGDGPQLDIVRRDIRRAGLDDCVELLGSRTRDEIRNILACSDAYLAPARLESFGIAALEARCVGLPVVAMACGGVGEFITDNVEGFLVDDDAGMAAATVALATDVELLHRMRTHNSVTSPPMAWDLVLDRHDDLYGRAIELGAKNTRGLRSVVV